MCVQACIHLLYNVYNLSLVLHGFSMGGKPDCKLGIDCCRFCDILISVCIFLFVILIIAVPSYFWLTSDTNNGSPCKFNLSIPLANPVKFPNESVADNGVIYSPGQYFIINDTVRGCICDIQPCIRKCCSEGEYYVKAPKRKATCQPEPPYFPFVNFTVPVYDISWNITNISQDHFWTLYGEPCLSKYILYPDDRNMLMVDGRISVDGEKEPEYKDASQYCLESMNGSEHEQIKTFVCFTPAPEKSEKAMFTLYSTGMLISAFFMVATVTVYSMVPELQNLHGKCLISHSASFCITYICLSIIQLDNDLPDFWCVFLAFVVEFTFLASFFWMNVMCFDIWWVFSGLRAPRGSAKERDHKKFLLYSLYAWGVPAIILAISLVMDLVPFIPDSFIKPGFGIKKCWFYDRSGILLYFYLPIAVVVVLNIAMFVSTACRLKAHTKETKVLHGSESRQNTKADKDRFNLYLKLFVVMGINWVMELVSFLVGGPKSLWYVTDIGNTLQGLMIFLIFVCKRRVFRLVAQKLCPGRLSSLGSKSGPSQSNTSSTLVSKTTQ